MMKKFNDQFIKSVKCPDDKARIDYRDKGLVLKVSRAGTKTFYFEYRIGETKRTKKLGRYPDISLKKAKDMIKIAKADLLAGKDPQADRDKLKQPIDKGLTVQQGLDTFIKRYAMDKIKSWKQYASVFNNLPPKVKNTAIADLNRITIRDYTQDLTKISNHKANATLKYLKSAFSWLHKHDYIKYNIIKDLPKPSPETDTASRERILSDSELQAVLQASHKMGYPFGTCTLVLAYLGQRKNEVAGMRWDELDFKNRIWTIPPDRTKNKQGHSVPLSDMVISILNGIPKQTGEYVFSTTAGNRPIQHGSKTKTVLNKVVGFNDWVIHDIRRTTATNLSKQGVSDIVISSVLNHSKKKIQGVTGIYNRNEFLPECTNALNNYADFLNKLQNNAYDNKVLAFKKAKSLF